MKSPFPVRRSAPVSFRWLGIAASILLAVAFLSRPPVAVAAEQGLVVVPIHTFTNGADGSRPYDGVIQDAAGNFYGTTGYGGGNNTGTVFKIAADGTFTTLHEFSATGYNADTNASFSNADGALPFGAPVIGPDGALYGTTDSGGPFGAGVIYRIATDGTFTVLVNFNPRQTGAHSQAPLIVGRDGNLYGTTHDGNGISIYPLLDGGGTVFKVTPAGVLTVLARLSGKNGSHPTAPLTEGSDGNFYGTTSDGGASDLGTVFKVTPQGALTVLHEFSALAKDYTNADGTHPRGGLAQGDNGLLYGVTIGGGAAQLGTVFTVSTDGDFHKLLDLGAGGIALLQYGTLLKAKDGNFYGANSSNTTLFQITPEGVLTVVARFNYDSGEASYGALIQGADGEFYGTTGTGGGSGYGTVFRVVPAPLLTLVATTPTVTLGGTGIYTLTLSEALDHDVIVPYDIEGDAYSGRDYVRLSGSTKIKAGKTSRKIKIQTQGDLEGESKKKVKLYIYSTAEYAVESTRSVKMVIRAP